MEAILEARTVSRDFAAAGGAVSALKAVSLRVPRGRLTILRGPSGSGTTLLNILGAPDAPTSGTVILEGEDITAEAERDRTRRRAMGLAIIDNSGSGKTTLLNILGGLGRPSAGTVLVDGQALLKFTDRELVAYRRNTVGFVWQNNARNLIPYLSAQENVELAVLLKDARDRRERARELLSLVGLARRAGGRLTALSGGEQQRVAVAIGLANRPRILLADEPTGEVDSKTAMMLLDVFREARRAYGVTVIIVTHDQRVSRTVDRVVAIRDGRTSSELVRRSYGVPAERVHPYEELAVVDRTGRVQIPRDILDSAGVREQVRVELEGGHIVLKAPQGREKR